MGLIGKITALNLCQIPTVVARQNDARATSLHQMRVYPLFLIHSSWKTWFVFKLQKDVAVFTATVPSPLVFRRSRIYFLCKQSSQRSARCLLILLGVTHFGAEWDCATHNTELCCRVCSWQCCNKERQSQIVSGGSGSGTAFLFLQYLSRHPDAWFYKENLKKKR